MRGFLVLSYITSTLLFVRTQRLVSPCPDVFSYEPVDEVQDGPRKDRWSGVIKLNSDVSLDYVFMDINLDGKADVLGTWFGHVSSKDNIHFSITNQTIMLSADVPMNTRIFVKYHDEQTVPEIKSILLNGRVICKASGAGSRTVTTPLPTTKRPAVNPTPRPVVGAADIFRGDFAPWHRKTPTPLGLNKKSSDTCGLVAPRANALITHSVSTTEGQWPWHAALYYSNVTDLSYICGASLISKRHVVTAAHCVTLRNSERVIDHTSLMVYLGKHNLLVWCGPHIQVTPVSGIYAHSKYNATNFRYDVAVLKLGKEAEYTTWVRPVCLWEGSTEVQGAGTVIGWGYDEFGRISEDLRQGTMPIVDPEQCVQSNREFYSEYYTFGTSYCAGFLNGVTVCNGDSGGGMVFARPNTNPPIWQLRGLVSISVALQNNVCDPGHYALFTDLTLFVDWINMVMAT